MRLLLVILTLHLFAVAHADDAEEAEVSDPAPFKIKKIIEWLRPKDPKGKEFYAQKSDVLKHQRDELMTTIEDLLKRKQPTEQQIELELRLAHIYVEAYNEANSSLGEGDAAKQIKIADEIWAKNYKLLKGALKAHPKHPRRDELLYTLATLCIDKQKTQEAVAALQELTTRYPNSSYANDSLVLLGDQLFDLGDFKNAETAFNTLVKRDYKPLLTYATYKMAWCSYNRQDPELSVSRFKWVIENETGQDNDQHFRMRNEALTDIAHPLADLRSLDRIVEFYRTQDPATFRRALEITAAKWNEKGTYHDAIMVWDMLLKMDPVHPKNPTYDIQIAGAHKMLHKDSQAFDYVITAQSKYDVGAPWYAANSEEARKNAYNDFEEACRNYATETDALGHKLKNAELIATAKVQYRAYLGFFSSSPQALTVRKFLAAILFDEHDYLGAAEQYDHIADESKDNEVRLSALTNSIACYGTQMNQDRKSQGLDEIKVNTLLKIPPKSEEALARIPYTSVEEKFIKRSEQFIQLFPQHKDATSVYYRMAYLRYFHQEISLASIAFSKIVKESPKAPEAVSAAYLNLDILNHRGENVALIEECKAYLKLPLEGKKIKADIADVLRHAELKRIAGLEAEGKYKEAAEQYIDYAATFGPEDKVLYESSLNNASIDFRKAGEELKAVAIEEKFLTLFPNSKLKEQMILQLGNSYDRMGKLQQAAKYFTLLATLYPKHSQSKSALKLASIYALSNKDYKKSESLLLEYRNRYPSETSTTNEALLELYRIQGDTNSQLKLLRSQQKLSPAEQFVRDARIEELSSKSGAFKDEKVLQRFLKFAQKYTQEIKASAAATEKYAQVRFLHAQIAQQTFNRIRFELPQKKLERMLELKLGILQSLEADYMEIAKLGSDQWGMAAVYAMSKNYRIFAEQVAQAPIPAELTEGALVAYKEGVASSIVNPFNEKALKLAKVCLKQTEDVHIFSAWTARCYRLASLLSPTDFPALRTVYAPTYQFAKLGEERKAPTAYALLPSDKRTLATYDESDVLAPRPTESRSLSTSPVRPTAEILTALELKPGDPVLFNELALSYVGQGNLLGARAAWLSMLSREPNAPAVVNNLAVLDFFNGDEKAATLKLFEAAKNGSPDANINLGVLALKYRNGNDATGYFANAEKQQPDNLLLKFGFVVADLQRVQLDDVKKRLTKLSGDFPDDPFTKTALELYLQDTGPK